MTSRLARLLLPVCLVLTLPMPNTSAQSAPTMPRQTVESATVTFQKEYQFLRYLPADFGADRDRHWPLLLFLHGAGERGADIAKVKMHGPPKLIEAGRDFPFVIISPQCPEGEWWNIVALAGLIERLCAELPIDQERIYLSGLSMGGFATWAMAIQHPDRYAAILPVCGGGDPHRARVLRDVPVWAFHGDADRVVVIERSREMVEAIKAAGGSPRFTVYEGVGHDAWSATYENPAVYEWLLSHRLGDRHTVAK